MSTVAMRRWMVAGLVILAVVAMSAPGGCTLAGDTGANKTGTGSGMPAGGMQSGTAATSVADPSVQTCSNCAGKGMAPTVAGEAATEAGVQVLKIGVKDGYYSPNEFTVKAGMSVKVVFSGKAKGCLANPKFPGLGKKADFTSGTATLDLGTLKIGVYQFACGMDMVGGKVIVQ